MKSSAERSFREQIGAAAKYGAYSPGLSGSGYSVPGNEEVLSPTQLEQLVNRISDRAVDAYVARVLSGQPKEAIFDGWDDLSLLKLRAHLALRLGVARGASDEAKDLGLTRTYPRRPGAVTAEGGPYLDGSSGATLRRGERKQLYDRITIRCEKLAARELAPDAAQKIDATRRDDSDEDFVIESVNLSYAFPNSIREKLVVTRSVTVRALRDGITEYRYTVPQALAKGRGEPEFELLAGPGGHLERVLPIARVGVSGYEYQVVIPFATPMMSTDEPRQFAWTVRNEVTEEFFDGHRLPRLGFYPTRELQTARLSIKFAPGRAPAKVGVLTNVRREVMDIFDPDGETIAVVDDYVEYTWHNLHLNRYCNLVWPR